jgi:hypothetical protein
MLQRLADANLVKARWSVSTRPRWKRTAALRTIVQRDGGDRYDEVVDMDGRRADRVFIARVDPRSRRYERQIVGQRMLGRPI